MRCNSVSTIYKNSEAGHYTTEVIRSVPESYVLGEEAVVVW